MINTLVSRYSDIFLKLWDYTVSKYCFVICLSFPTKQHMQTSLYVCEYIPKTALLMAVAYPIVWMSCNSFNQSQRSH